LPIPLFLYLPLNFGDYHLVVLCNAAGLMWVTALFADEGVVRIEAGIWVIGSFAPCFGAYANSIKELSEIVTA